MSPLLQTKSHLIIAAMDLAHQVDAVCAPLDCLRGTTEDEYGLCNTGAWIQAPTQGRTNTLQVPPFLGVRTRVTVPDASVRAQVLVRDVVDLTLQRLAYWGQVPHQSVTAAICSHLKKSWRDDIHRSDPVLCMLGGVLADTQRYLESFVGSDRWVMHFFSYRGADIVVDKTIDYRIYAYMNERGLNDHRDPRGKRTPHARRELPDFDG